MLPCRSTSQDAAPSGPPSPMSPVQSLLRRLTPLTPHTLRGRKGWRDMTQKLRIFNFLHSLLFWAPQSPDHPCCLSTSRLPTPPSAAHDTHLPLSRCPPQSQTPGHQCCHPCFLRARCHCSDLQGQQKTNQAHFNTQAFQYRAKLRPEGKRAAQKVTHTLHRALLARERGTAIPFSPSQ